jgi:hypothetical protein
MFRRLGVGILWDGPRNFVRRFTKHFGSCSKVGLGDGANS